MLNVKKENLDELNKIFKKYCPNAEIWAYGSRVNGDFHSGSDLDLVVKDFHDKNKSVYELKELINNSVIPFLVDIQEFDKLPSSFQDEIKRNYEKIFSNN